MEIVKLTKDNIPEVSQKSGRSEEDLLRSYLLAKSKDKVCIILVHKTGDK
jgi:hypothetical protein